MYRVQGERPLIRDWFVLTIYFSFRSIVVKERVFWVCDFGFIVVTSAQKRFSEDISQLNAVMRETSLWLIHAIFLPSLPR